LRLYPATDGYRIIWTEVVTPPSGDTPGTYRIVVYNTLMGAREKEFNEVPSPDRIPRASISNQYVAYVVNAAPNTYEIKVYDLQTQKSFFNTSDPSTEIAYLKVLGTLILSMQQHGNEGWTLRFHDVQ
jgi:hypothetical protein